MTELNKINDLRVRQNSLRNNGSRGRSGRLIRGRNSVNAIGLKAGNDRLPDIFALGLEPPLRRRPQSRVKLRRGIKGHRDSLVRLGHDLSSMRGWVIWKAQAGAAAL
jgi:hypothetical protein